MYCQRLIYTFLFVGLLAGSSCSSSLTNDITRLKNIQISLPLDEMEYLKSFVTSYRESDSISEELWFVVYKDQNSCSTCEVSHIGQWNSIIKKANDILPVKFFFIFAPKKEEEHHQIESMYKTGRYIQNIYIDCHLAFEKRNPDLNKAQYHSFLMNKTGNLLYIGDPTESYRNEKNLLNVLEYYVKNIIPNQTDNHN